MGRKGYTFAEDAMFEAEAIQRTKGKILPPGLLFFYARCSTDKQDTSIAVQVAHMEAEFPKVYEPLGYRFGGVYCDEGLSGDKKIHHRPEGRKMLAKLEPGDAVLTSKLDRLSRRLGDWGERMRTWKITGIRYHSLDVSGGREDICSTDAWFMAAMMMVFSEQELRKIRARVKAQKSYSRSVGLAAGGIPYGYQNVDGRLVVHPEKYARLLKIVSLRDEYGLTWDQIAAHFHKEDCEAAGMEYTGSAFCPHFKDKKTIWRFYQGYKASEAQNGHPAAT